MPPRPAAILFDWDNTLVDAWAGVAAALNAALAAFGKPVWTTEEVRARVRVSLRDSFPPCSATSGPARATSSTRRSSRGTSTT